MSFLVFCPNCYLFLYLVTLLFSFAECFFSVVELGSRRPLLSLFFFFARLFVSLLLKLPFLFWGAVFPYHQ